MAENSNVSNRNNVTKLHYMPRFNIGVVFLAIIFIYLVISFVLYLTKEKILTYEVCAGQLVSENIFSGVAVFDESIESSNTAGYINYFLQDSARAGVNTIICIVDETGSISSKLTADINENELSTSNLNSIGHRLTAYTKTFDSGKFYQSYQVLSDVSSVITEFNANYMVDSLNELLQPENTFVDVVKPDKSTMVSFYTDSLYGLTEYDVTKETFNQENYTVNNLKNRELVGVGDTLYRKIDSDTWKIVFPLTETQLNQFSAISSVTVKLLPENINANAAFSILNTADGSYGVLTLQRYLVNYINSRFIDFELTQTAVSGLKIPISSVCEKEFFTIPVEYGYISDEDNDTGFLMLTYDSNGNQVRKFVSATYYANDNGYYYVSKDIFNIGDCIVKPPDSEGITYEDTIYIVGTVASLKGVYCTNKGYCQFRQVSIVDRNDEYYIIERGTAYGLSIYDYIILNAELVTENQIIY